MGPRGKKHKQPDQPTIEDDVKTNPKTLYFFFFVNFISQVLCKVLCNQVSNLYLDETKQKKEDKKS